jgi:hypothetical protein
MSNNKLYQINKCYKCPNCKTIYLEKLRILRHNGYCTQPLDILKCNKCFGEFTYEQ